MSSECEVSCADIVRCENGVERRVWCGRLDVGTASLFAVNQAEDADDVHAGLLGGLNRSDGGATGGADIIDDNDVGSDLMKAFDATTRAVCLLGLADEEAVDDLTVVRCAVVVLVVVPGAGRGGIRDQRVGSHGEPADGFGLWEVLADEIEENEAGEAAAFGVQSCGAAVDVVVGLLAAGEGEVAQAEGVGGNEMQKVGAIVGWHGQYQF